MSMPIEDLLMPMLVTGAVGVLVGLVLSGWLRAPLRGDGAAAEPAAGGEPRPVAAPTERPRAQAEEPSRPRNRAKAPPPAPADLLVVDDSAVARVKLRRLLEAAGYEVHLASDGAEALQMLQAGRYALMLTDLEMPNMDGATLIEHCRRLPHTAGMPILAITGHENLRVKFNECRSISGVHRKPWIDDILLSHIAALAGTPRVHPIPGAAWAARQRATTAPVTRPADLAAH